MEARSKPRVSCRQQSVTILGSLRCFEVVEIQIRSLMLWTYSDTGSAVIFAAP